MATLMELYGLRLNEGRLRAPTATRSSFLDRRPKPRIQVGDVIGNRDHPSTPRRAHTAYRLVVSGVLCPGGGFCDDNWLSCHVARVCREPPGFLEGQPFARRRAQDRAKGSARQLAESEIAGERRLVFTLWHQQALFSARRAHSCCPCRCEEHRRRGGGPGPGRSQLSLCHAAQRAGVLSDWAEPATTVGVSCARRSLPAARPGWRPFWGRGHPGWNAVRSLCSGRREFNLLQPVPWLYTCGARGGAAVSAGAVAGRCPVLIRWPSSRGGQHKVERGQKASPLAVWHDRGLVMA